MAGSKSSEQGRLPIPDPAATAQAEEPAAEAGVHKTAPERRRIAIQALGSQLDPHLEGSAARRLRSIIDAGPRPLVISGDIDGLVSAAMLASVAPGWEVVGIVTASATLHVHPDHVGGVPEDAFLVDLFSPGYDNVSNHIVEFGPKRIQIDAVRQSFEVWDMLVRTSAEKRFLAVPGIWADTVACYDGAGKANSAKYKYPLGTAQLLLALLEAAGYPPRFYDRHYLPWLIANCDGGVSTFHNYAYNASVWWPTMAAAVGPASLSEQVYQRVATMRPHDFIDAVNRLDREVQASGQRAWLNDDWNLVDQSRGTLERTFRWLADLTGWRDPIRDGVDSLMHWKSLDVTASGMVYIGGQNYKATKADPDAAAAAILAAGKALNANFYMGGFSGSRFNWVGGW